VVQALKAKGFKVIAGDYANYAYILANEKTGSSTEKY